MQRKETIGDSGCRDLRHLRTHLGLALLIVGAALAVACARAERPPSEPLIVETQPPPMQELRWSNGRLPKSLDPAKASAAPETDIVRALYEGLTDIDPKTLREVPAAAERWTSSPDFTFWTFYLRDGLKWSNGEAVTAGDFVRSWTRVAKMGTSAPNRNLLFNIAGLRSLALSDGGNILVAPGTSLGLLPESPQNAPTAGPAIAPKTAQPLPFSTPTQTPGEQAMPPPPPPARPQNSPSIQAEVMAESDRVLSVRLLLPDRDFAKLVASPVFRPVYGNPGPNEADNLSPTLVSNGAFRLSAAGSDGITLARSDNYWNRQSVSLERVRFIAKAKAEDALEAYRAGDLDAVTNADFEPLALKLLSPYNDFREVTHGALNFYEINIKKPPFSDLRVRRALAMAIDRATLTEGELQGSTQPALTFLPFSPQTVGRITEDRDAARLLLEQAGFPDGLNFPTIRLVVNRNDVQLRIARLVAKMWKQNLNIDTEIAVVETAEVETSRASGDFDLIRRNAVFPSNDEMMSIRSIFDAAESLNAQASNQKRKGDGERPTEGALPPPAATDATQMSADQSQILTERDALAELRAIPLYFPSSYSLVKPYVSGFDFNSIEALSLANVSIDNNWQPK